MTLLTDELRSLLGTTRVYVAPEAFGAASGRYFALAVGDHNPLYTDAEVARAHGLRGVTAPPTLICETNQYTGLRPDAEGYGGHTWAIELPGTRQVRGGNRYIFHRRLRPEDAVTATWEVTGLDEKVTRAGQDMLVVTSRATYTDHDGELIAQNDETVIYVALREVTT